MKKVKLLRSYLNQKEGEERIVTEREGELLFKLGIAEKPKKDYAKNRDIGKGDPKRNKETKVLSERKEESD